MSQANLAERLPDTLMSQASSPLHILLVDDHRYNRDILRFMLEDVGHRCIEAADGEEACVQWRNHPDIDLILLDVHMPKMDGIETARQIRAELAAANSTKTGFVSIIFVTALDNTDVLVQCLEAGGDDFVPKPVNERVLLSKVVAHARYRDNFHELRSAHARLQYHQHGIEREHRMVEQIFNSTLDHADTVCENVVLYTSPMSMFNGDLVLRAPSPAGGEYILIGDFTGHGLAAAVGSMPVQSIFFSATRKQTSIAEIAIECNRQLHSVLPEGMFFCAAIMHIDSDGQRLSLWSGGMADGLYVSSDGRKVTRLPGDHPPLGILPPTDFDDSLQLHDLAYGGHLYFYTDGLLEARNESNEQFGRRRLEEALCAIPAGRVPHLAALVREFQGGNSQCDDLSMVEIHCAPLTHRAKISGALIDMGKRYRAADHFAWQTEFAWRGRDLAEVTMVAAAMDFVRPVPGIELHEDKLFTIFSELFSNALEHGVLQLDSNIKDSAEGFQRYYQLRAERLSAVAGEFIKVRLAYHCGTPNRLTISVTDSGAGFDVDRVVSDCEARYGRGIHLLKSLCSSLEYSDGGRTTVASYDFR